MGPRPSSLDRFRGCILGAAIGDALGAPYEHDRSGVRLDKNGYGVGVYNTNPGEATDDSTLLRFHVDALVRAKFNRPARASIYMEHLAEWYKSNPKDMGGQTRAAIQAYLEGKPAPDTNSCGNGSLMAVAPAGLVAHNASEAGALGHDFSLNTHPNELCRYVCGVFATAIYLVSRTDRYERVIPTVAVPSWIPIDGRGQGYVAVTAGLAFEALEIAEDSKSGFEALEWVISRGGDTDTNASVAGALIGARMGMSAWTEPGWLVETLQGTDDWFSLADALYLGFENA